MKEEEGKEEGWIQRTVGMILLRVGGGGMEQEGGSGAGISLRRVGHDLSYFCAIILPVAWDRAGRRGRLRMGLRLGNHEESPGGLQRRAEPGMVVEGWRGGGISQGEVRTGAGEGGLVFLEVEKSRPIIPAKKSK